VAWQAVARTTTPGTTSRAHLEENIAAANLPLDTDDLTHLAAT
jgi:aryl-alcohol dehydrogenase-like predicted oxidoreductase